MARLSKGIDLENANLVWPGAPRQAMLVSKVLQDSQAHVVNLSDSGKETWKIDGKIIKP